MRFSRNINDNETDTHVYVHDKRHALRRASIITLDEEQTQKNNMRENVNTSPKVWYDFN